MKCHKREMLFVISFKTETETIVTIYFIEAGSKFYLHNKFYFFRKSIF